jgi:cytochrome P450
MGRTHQLDAPASAAHPFAEVEVGGVTIGAGEKVLLFLAAANRDPRRWEHPDQFDIRSRAVGHVGFGFGIHACVGASLARLEGEVLLEALARQVATGELAGQPHAASTTPSAASPTSPLTPHPISG